jgi:adenylate kinase
MTQASKVYCFFGMQGSGKSTQAKMLAEKLHLPYFNTGNVLRERSVEEDRLGSKLRILMTSGHLISDDIIHDIFSSFIRETASLGGFITDGFPRNISQYKHFKHLGIISNWDITAVEIAITEKVALKRISSRIEVVAGKKVIREDDKPETVKKRILTYKRETLPLLQAFKEEFNLIKIDGIPSIEVVFEEVCRKLGL